MATIDIIILIALGAGVIIGFMKGFIRQLASILGLIVGLLAAKALYTSLAVKLCPTVTDSMTVAQILAFVIIWIAVPLIFTLVASVLTKAMEAVSLGWLNRLLGAGLGALKYLLLVSLVVCVIQFIDTDSQLISQTKKEESLLYYPMERFAGMFFPAAKEVTQQYILK
ncbi:CvpA family protein [Bacteroides sp.]|uniref:CvpA family protein n=1 Tax=Bacteroides sp. TaxID=29523 RepID=UPI003526E2E3